MWWRGDVVIVGVLCGDEMVMITVVGVVWQLL